MFVADVGSSAAIAANGPSRNLSEQDGHVNVLGTSLAGSVVTFLSRIARPTLDAAAIRPGQAQALWYLGVRRTKTVHHACASRRRKLACLVAHSDPFRGGSY